MIQFRKKLLRFIILLLLPIPLTAAEYHLTVDNKQVNFTGEGATGVAVNDSIPAPLLRLKEGEASIIHVTNNMDKETSLHWHGLVIPTDMDGVPGLSFDGIQPGETFTYRFTPRQSGTYWYHSHSGFQEQSGAYGPIIIEPAKKDPASYDHDYIVMLSDWTDEDPNDVLKHLKSQSDYYKNPKPTLPGLIRKLADAEGGKESRILSERAGFARMRMDPTDISDVSGFTYLLNGMNSSRNWTGLFKKGERIRLRFINAGAATYFDVKIPGLKMRVVAADGQNVKPVEIDAFNIAIAETYDVIVTPTEEKAYTIFAQAMDRSGYVRGTLAPQEGIQAPIPPMDKRKVLTMREVMPEHTKHQHSHHNMMEHHRMGPVVLKYEDLKSLENTSGDVTREITLRLTGNMERYFWSFNDLKYSMAEPIQFEFGERVRVKLVNETMMNHPIHLHGLWQVLQNGQKEYSPKKHTINVPPKQSVTVEVPVDNRGRWAFHCHILYHMATGMFREVRVK
ncbi:copper resistance system multicopper oxidase [Pseudomonadota bacterium]